MPPDDEEFIRTIARATVALIIAHERGDPVEAVVALERLLKIIAAHGTTESRKSTALARAVLFSR